jgi:hypothetical protein
MPAKASRKKPTMTDDHKAALAVGRNEGRAVRRYLDALEAHRPKRGRKRTAETIKKRLAAVDRESAGSDKLTQLRLVQERMDLEAEMGLMTARDDLGHLEADFVKVARNYSARRHITYGAWRAVGVSAGTLKKAGIARSA